MVKSTIAVPAKPELGHQIRSDHMSWICRAPEKQLQKTDSRKNRVEILYVVA